MPKWIAPALPYSERCALQLELVLIQEWLSDTLLQQSIRLQMPVLVCVWVGVIPNHFVDVDVADAYELQVSDLHTVVPNFQDQERSYNRILPIHRAKHGISIP
jgi:hypothetical protein